MATPAKAAARRAGGSPWITSSLVAMAGLCGHPTTCKHSATARTHATRLKTGVENSSRARFERAASNAGWYALVEELAQPSFFRNRASSCPSATRGRSDPRCSRKLLSNRSGAQSARRASTKRPVPGGSDVRASLPATRRPRSQVTNFSVDAGSSSSTVRFGRVCEFLISRDRWARPLP